MPVPERKDGESHDDFMDRCVPSDDVQDLALEGTDGDEARNAKAVAICFSQSRKGPGSRHARNVTALQAAPHLIRREQHEGREHIVVPAVLLAEGVIKGLGQAEPELVLASEFGDPAEAWNGRPVVIREHPRANGQAISANSPHLHDAVALGKIFNAHVEDRKLKGEIWIDTAKAQRLGADARQIVQALQHGEQVEVSTGYWAETEAISGVHDGRDFMAVQRNIRPDHLLLVPLGEKGACSWEDGCGAPRVNTPSCCDACARGDPCEAEMRTHGENLAATLNRIIDGNDSDRGEVIDRMATAAEIDKSTVNQILNGSIKCPPRERLAGFARTLGVSTDRLITSARRDGCDYSMRDNLRFEDIAGAKMLFAANRKRSDVDKRMAVEAALRSEGDSSGEIVALFDDAVVYHAFEPETGFTMLRRTYAIGDGGVVTLGKNKEHVRPETSFVSVRTNSADEPDANLDPSAISANSETPTMPDPASDRVAKLIAHQHSPYTDDDSAWLEAAPADRIDALIAECERQAEAAKQPPPEPPKAEAPRTADDLMALMRDCPEPDLRSFVLRGLREGRERKDSLVARIRSHESGARIAEETLRSRDIEELEAMAGLMGEPQPDYSPRGGVRTMEANAGDLPPPPPPLIPSKES